MSLFYCAACVLFFCVLQGCAAVGGQSTVAKKTAGNIRAVPSAGLFIPANAFSAPKLASQQKKETQSVPPSPALVSKQAVVPFVSKVVLYSSPTTRAFFDQAGLDGSFATTSWEQFLKKYKIPYVLASSVSELRAQPSGVLVLPSSVALTERERESIVDFRARGGNVFATWLSGVRGEKGEWLGFSFMEKALDVRVIGTTASENEDNFLMPHGDSPVSQFLPAGQRVWLERAKEWHPLRLVGRFPAAHMMDWSRSFSTEKTTTVMSFDERIIAVTQAEKSHTNITSRSVVLGFPERLLMTADPQFVEALMHNALSWLLRLPTAHVAAWPAGYNNGLLWAIDAAEIIVDTDITFATYLEQAGVKATFYTLSDNAIKSAKNLQLLQSKGHEVALMADSFVGFKNQAAPVQVARLQKMKLKMREAGISISESPGFHAPSESQDANTVSALTTLGYGHFIGTQDLTESRLPFFLGNKNVDQKNSTVALPRTQRGPEDAAEEGDIDEALAAFFAELELAQSMGGLSVVRMPNQGLLTLEQLRAIAEGVKSRRKNTWVATGTQIASWWRERSRVNARIEGDATGGELRVDISGDSNLVEPVVVWLNLPVSQSTLSLSPASSKEAASPAVATIAVDTFRSGVVLQGLNPGTYRWKLNFQNPKAIN